MVISEFTPFNLLYIWKINKVYQTPLVITNKNISASFYSEHKYNKLYQKYAYHRFVSTRPLAKWVEYLPKVQETGVQSQVESYQRLKKIVLDATLLNTQHYMARIKRKVEKSREWSTILLYTLCSSYWKGSLWITLDKGRQLY